VKEKLNLSLNNKSKYFPAKAGIDFCGYIIFENYVLLRKRFKKKIKKQIMVWKYLKSINKLDVAKKRRILASFMGHASHASSYNFIKKITAMINEI
jgi:hypothetical protein